MLAGLVVREFAGPGAGHRADRGCGRLRWCEQPDPQTRCRRALGGPRGRYGRPAPPTGFRGGLCSGPPRHAGSRRRPTVSSANFNGPPPGRPVLLRKCLRGIGMTGGRRRPLNASRPRSTSPGSHKVRTSSVRAERVDAGGRLAAFDRGSQSARSRWPGLCGFRCPISQDAGRPIPDSGSTFRLGVQAGPISAGRAWGATTWPPMCCCVLPRLASCSPPWPPNWVHAYPAVFQLASRAGVGPGSHEAAGRSHGRAPGPSRQRRRRRDRTEPGVNEEDLLFGEVLRRLARARGSVKATVAVEHGVIVAAWPPVFTICEFYRDLRDLHSDRRRGAGRWPRSRRRSTGPRLDSAAGSFIAGSCWRTTVSAGLSRRPPLGWRCWVAW